jgi:hypothetical protein
MATADLATRVARVCLCVSRAVALVLTLAALICFCLRSMSALVFVWYLFRYTRTGLSKHRNVPVTPSLTCVCRHRSSSKNLESRSVISANLLQSAAGL